MEIDTADITGVILAGGQARRMGGKDKGLIEISGKPMIEYVIAGLKPQLGKILINANRNHDVYGRYGFPVIADMHEGYNGPLEGMASCMRVIETGYMLTLPCDSPNVPEDYARRMTVTAAAENADICVADNGQRIQPVFSLLNCNLLQSLLQYLDSGQRKIDLWFQQHRMCKVDFSDRPDTFINVNTADDVRNMENRLS